jgi:hypothetical protein
MYRWLISACHTSPISAAAEYTSVSGRFMSHFTYSTFALQRNSE